MGSNIDATKTHPVISDLIDRGKVSRLQLRVVFLCIVFNMLDGFDITAMAVTVNDVGIEMELSADKLGMVFSFSLAGMMLGAMFLAALSDVFGRRIVIICSLLVMGSSVLTTAYVSELYTLIFLRFISGLSAGALLASQATLASEYSPERYRALSVAAVTAGYPLGAMMTGIVAESIVPDFGWRSMFITGGVVTLAMAAIAFLFLPESLHFLFTKQPQGGLVKVNRLLKTFKVAPLDTLSALGIDAESERNKKRSVLAGMYKLVTPEYRRSTFILWSAFFMCLYTMYFLMSWIPKLMVGAGFSVQVGNQAFTLFNFGGVLGIFLLGYLATFGALSAIVSLFLILSAITMGVVALFPGNEYVLQLLIFVVGLTLQGGFTGLYAVAAKLYPTDIRGTGVGWAIGLGRFGAVVGPAVAGLTIAADISMSFNFMIFAVPMVLGGLLAYRLNIS